MSQRVRATGGLCFAMWWVVLSAGGTGAVQTGSRDAKKLINPVKATPQSVAMGQQIYQRHCSICHKPDGKGHPPMASTGTGPSDLTDARWDYGSSDGEIFASIRNGIGPNFVMKAYKDTIPERDTWHLVNYLRRLNSAPKR